MKKMNVLLVLTIFFLMAVGNASAQLVDPMNVLDDIQRGESAWREAREIRDFHRAERTGYLRERNHIVGRRWQSSGVFYTSGRSYRGGYGYWRGGGWEDIASVGVDVVGDVLVNNKTQNTIRDASDKQYELEMKRLEMQEARELREFKARQEQARWERQQAEQAYSQPQPQAQPYKSPVSYRLPRSRSYVVENHSSCVVSIVQGGDVKIDQLNPGRYQAAYLKGGDDPVEVMGDNSCVVTHRFERAKIVITGGR